MKARVYEASLLISLVLAGCAPPEGRFRCTTDADCPSGMTCRRGEDPSQLLCYSGSGVDGGATPDSGIDADGGPGVDGGPRIDGGPLDAGGEDGGPDGGPVCSPACASGEDCCGGSCLPLDTVTNCGECGRTCADAPNADAVCGAGSCGFTCRPGFDDCNGNPADGCEADLTSPATCGACGTTCAPGAACIAGPTGRMCEPCPGATLCGESCVDTTSDPMHCGGCGIVCAPRPNADVTCSPSGCRYTCRTGFGDCDGDLGSSAGNGCESDLTRDRNRCGTCSTSCLADQECVSGSCNLCVPTAATAPEASFPASLPGRSPRCFTDSSSTATTTTCPIVQCGLLSTWALSYDDNRSSFFVVTVDDTGTVRAGNERTGARYVWQSSVDSGTGTFTFRGQSTGQVTRPWSEARLP